MVINFDPPEEPLTVGSNRHRAMTPSFLRRSIHCCLHALFQPCNICTQRQSAMLLRSVAPCMCLGSVAHKQEFSGETLLCRNRCPSFGPESKCARIVLPFPSLSGRNGSDVCRRPENLRPGREGGALSQREKCFQVVQALPPWDCPLCLFFSCLGAAHGFMPLSMIMCSSSLHAAFSTFDAEVPPGWFSFEYFPPKTPEGVENLRKRIETPRQPV